MLNIPDSINDDVVLAFALANGYQETIIITPASPETMTYDANNNPVNVPAVAEVDGDNPESPEDFVTQLLTDQMIAIYEQSQIAVQTAEIQASVAQQIADATQQVKDSITTAKNNMSQKTTLKTNA